MKNILNTLLIAALCLCHSGCKWEKAQPVTEPQPEVPCEEVPLIGSGIGGFVQYSIKDKYLYSIPSSNPENPQELLFIRGNPSSNRTDICVYNLTQKQLKVVYSATPLGSGGPVWGSGGWIFFPTEDFQVWKIRQDGQGLTQVSAYPPALFPRSNLQLKRVLYYHFWNVSQFTGHLYVCGEDGTLLDSVSAGRFVGGGLVAWENSSQIAAFSYKTLDSLPVVLGSIDVIDPQSKSRKSVSTYTTETDHECGLCWIDENTLIYGLLEGLYKVNILTGETTLIRKTCNAKYYAAFSYSPQLKRITATKITQKLLDNDVVEISSRLCLLDTNGKEVEELAIPE